MKPQIRPYIVEVKQKRGRPKRNRSIWGDIDLSAIAADGLNEAAAAEPKNFQLIDSDATANKAEDGNRQAEHLMADPQETESTQTLTAEPPRQKSLKQRRRLREPGRQQKHSRSGQRPRALPKRPCRNPLPFPPPRVFAKPTPPASAHRNSARSGSRSTAARASKLRQGRPASRSRPIISGRRRQRRPRRAVN